MQLSTASTKDSRMVKQRAFGRRIDQQPRFSRAKDEIAIAASSAPAMPASASPPSSIEIVAPSVDEELREWAKARKQGFRIPWRQVSLMASLCFGIASLVLPDSLNGGVQWLLYGLAAASLYGGFVKRRKRRETGH
jgi:hypothetical protein